MKTCPKCGSAHQKNGRFCSRPCANSRGPRTSKVKRKMSQSAKKYFKEHGYIGGFGNKSPHNKNPKNPW
jgi:hypothetical protein